MISDANGLASVTPASAGIAGPVEVEISASAGTTAVQNFEVESAWMPPGTELALRNRTRKAPSHSYSLDRDFDRAARPKQKN
jgi:hypothetical protein